MPARLGSSTTTRNLACQMGVAGSEVVAEGDASASECVSGMLCCTRVCTVAVAGPGKPREAYFRISHVGLVRRPAPYRASWV